MEVSTTPDHTQPPIDDCPKIPPGPVLTANAFFGSDGTAANLLDVGQCLYLTSGRMAIALALELGKIESGDEVLVPAYHCSSMVAPILHADASPVYYKILPDMTIDLDDIATKVTHNTKALLATHYFGFMQDLPKLRAFCDEHGLLLIEDCAHAFFGEVNNVPVGSYGDYAIGSLMKFFPVFDGGCLVSNQHDLSGVTLNSGGKGFEFQSLINNLEKSFQYGRLPVLKWLLILPLTMMNSVWRSVKNSRKRRGQSTKSAPVASGGGFDFDHEWIHTRSSYSTNRLIQALPYASIIEKRRDNYTYLANALSRCRTYYPLKETLGKSTVPYVFPLYVEYPDPGFYKLRSAGVPLMRWEFISDSIDEHTCELSFCYSRHLIQIPCHQALTKKELDWMIESIKREFS
jgi:perosamine synthetase